MKAKQKKYILENKENKSIKEMSKELGIKERKIRKFLSTLKKDKITIQEGNLSQGKRYSKKSEILIFFGIFIVAFLVRVIYLNQIKTNPFFTPFYHGLDDYLYDSWAMEVAGGNILGKEVFYGLPLYPYFLGFIYFLFGHSVYIAKLIQLMIGALSCSLVYLIGRKVFSRAAGIISAFIFTFYAMAIYFEGQFVSSSLSIFLNLLVILLLLSTINRSSLKKWMLIGFLTGISSLANASIFVFIPFIIVWSFITFKQNSRKKIFKNLLFFIIGIILIITPITLRNYIVSKDFVPITAHSGITFYAGNNPGSDGAFYMPKEVGTSVIDSKENAKIVAERISGKKLKPSEISDFWFNQSMQFIKKDPAKYTSLLFRKMFLFWNAYEIPDIMPMEFFKQYAPLLKLPLFNFALICPLALLGIFIIYKENNPKTLLLEFFIASVFISTTIYFVNSRYRLIAVPLMAVFAGFSAYWIYRNIKEKHIDKLVLPGVLLIVIFFITHIKILEFGMAQSYNNLGIILKRQGLYEEAMQEYKKAIKEDPNYPSPYFNLALLYIEKRQNVKAIEYLNKAVEVNPNFIKAHQKLVELYTASGQTEKALYHKSQLKQLRNQ